MQNNSPESVFKILEQVNAVEASPFLFTRIQQRIDRETQEKVTSAFSRGVFASLVLLIIFNVFVISHHVGIKKGKNIAAIANELTPSNQLY